MSDLYRHFFDYNLSVTQILNIVLCNKTFTKLRLVKYHHMFILIFIRTITASSQFSLLKQLESLKKRFNMLKCQEVKCLGFNMLKCQEVKCLGLPGDTDTSFTPVP